MESCVSVRRKDVKPGRISWKGSRMKKMIANLTPITSKLLIECLDSILPSLTDLFNSSLASGIFPQCLKSALVTPILKKRCLDHNDLNNYL